jgi:hypothetical protein
MPAPSMLTRGERRESRRLRNPSPCPGGGIKRGGSGHTQAHRRRRGRFSPQPSFSPKACTYLSSYIPVPASLSPLPDQGEGDASNVSVGWGSPFSLLTKTLPTTRLSHNLPMLLLHLSRAPLSPSPCRGRPYLTRAKLRNAAPGPLDKLARRANECARCVKKSKRGDRALFGEEVRVDEKSYQILLRFLPRTMRRVATNPFPQPLPMPVTP